MGYFPFFVELEGREGLIIGGGSVALRKVRKILPYGPKLTVAAAEVGPEITAIPGICVLREAFTEALLAARDWTFVIAATDDREVNRRIAGLCRTRRIAVNAVDDREACSFLFPALVRRGRLSVGVSTGGASPSGAIYVKEKLDGLLPDAFGEILDWLDAGRERVKEEIGSEAVRSACFAALFAACLRAEGPLPDAEFWKLLEEFRAEGADKEERHG